MSRGTFAAFAMRFVRQRVNACGVDPSIVEIEERANGDGEIDRFIRPARVVQWHHVFGANPRRFAIDLVDEAQQNLFRLAEPRRLEVAKNPPDQLLTPQ